MDLASLKNRLSKVNVLKDAGILIFRRVHEIIRPVFYSFRANYQHLRQADHVLKRT